MNIPSLLFYFLHKTQLASVPWRLQKSWCCSRVGHTAQKATGEHSRSCFQTLALGKSRQFIFQLEWTKRSLKCMESMGGDNENWNAVVPGWFTYYRCFIINRIHRSINPNACKRNPSLKKKAKMMHRKMKAFIFMSKPQGHNTACSFSIMYRRSMKLQRNLHNNN